MHETKISIITATYNAIDYLPRLVASLRAQTCKNFEWFVADGGSTDGTLDILKQVKDLNIIVDSRLDFGIYDALNRAIKKCSGEFYHVLGADDELDSCSIENFLNVLEQNCSFDFIVACVNKNGIIVNSEKKWKFLYSQRAYISTHAVGTLINKKLHEKFGYYSSKFPIAADQLFLKSVGDSGARIYYADFVAGNFGSDGVSCRDMVGSLSEFFRIQLMTGEWKPLQILIYFLRILKNYNKI
jgi:glycosyltransferase involved in cell wall biosynthesis